MSMHLVRRRLVPAISAIALALAGLGGGAAFATTAAPAGMMTAPVAVTATPVTATPDPGVGVVPGTVYLRMSGADRYATAVELTKRHFYGDPGPTTDTLYLVSGENFPDALAAAPIAALNRAALLLTAKGGLPAVVANEIKRLKPTTIVVVGGPGAISDAVVQALKPLAKTVTRLAGTDRYDTARQVIRYGLLDHPRFTVDQPGGPMFDIQGALGDDGKKHFFTELEWEAVYERMYGADPKRGMTLFMATGENFPDALAIGAIGGNWFSGWAGPVLLERGSGSTVSPENAALMRDLMHTYGVNGSGADSTTFLIGGTAAISTDLELAVGELGVTGLVERVAGDNRYETSQQVAYYFAPEDPELHINADVYRNPEIMLASGVNYPDALAGSALAAVENSLLVVVPPTCIPSEVFHIQRLYTANQFTLIGGKAALTSDVARFTACK